MKPHRPDNSNPHWIKKKKLPLCERWQRNTIKFETIPLLTDGKLNCRYTGLEFTLIGHGKNRCRKQTN